MPKARRKDWGGNLGCGSSREKHRKEHNLLANKDLRLVITRKTNDEITPGASLMGAFLQINQEMRGY